MHSLMLMRGELADAIVIADCFDQHLTLGDGQRQRLYGKDVESGLAGEHASQISVFPQNLPWAICGQYDESAFLAWPAKAVRSRPSDPRLF